MHESTQTSGADAHDPREHGPYGELDREDWARLAGQLAVPFTDDVIDALRGLGDPVDATEVREVYLPLSRLLSMYVAAAGILHDATNEFLGGTGSRTPYVIGVAGSVAVGKSTTARVLRELLAAWPAHPKVTLVTTDGFLLPNAELERRGILQRKGFPESYDQRALLRFVIDVKSGNSPVTAPVYSHSAVRHRARRRDRGGPTRHPHRRRPQRAATRAVPR